MRPISRVALILLAAATCAGAQTPSSTLEERMSQAEFRAAGLDKLSPQELAQLNSWLETHGGTRVVNRNGFATEFYPDSADRDDIVTLAEHAVWGDDEVDPREWDLVDKLVEVLGVERD